MDHFATKHLAAEGPGRVLLVDDQPAVLKAIGGQLRSWGYQVSAAHGGVAGTVHFSSKLFDVVVTDLQMPDLNGLAVLAHIQQHSPQTPVIVLAAPSDLNDVRLAIHRGAFDYIQKDEVHIIRRIVLNEKQQPEAPDPLATALDRALQHVRLLAMNRLLIQELEGRNAELHEEREELHSALERLKSAQSEIVVMEKAASLTVLTAGVGNEINNPLAALQVNVNLLGDWAIEALEQRPVEDDDIGEVVQACREGLGRLGDVVRTLRSFTQHMQQDSTTQHEMLPLRPLIEELGDELSLSFPEAPPIRLRLTIAANLGAEAILWGPPHVMRQILRNILENAIEAQLCVGQPALVICLNVECRGPLMELEITDTGEGIEATSLGHVFDPFFSTKGASGLGLAIAHGLCTRLGGKIGIMSSAEGTTVTLSLPMAEGLQKRALKCA